MFKYVIGTAVSCKFLMLKHALLTMYLLGGSP